MRDINEEEKYLRELKREKWLKELMGSISTRDKKWVLETYNREEWHNIIETIYHHHRYYHRFKNTKISKGALKLVKTILNNCNKLLFPAILKYNTNFFAYPEAYRFYMYDSHGKVFNSELPLKYLLKHNNIVVTQDEDEQSIIEYVE